MSCVTRLLILRGTTAQRTAMTPLEGELVYDTDLGQVFIGDGVTPGGNPLTAETNLTLNARNETGTTITKGSAVYINGATGNRPTIALADNSTDATADKTLGLVFSDISDNTDGVVMVEGILEGLDTSAFAEGDLLYLDTNGDLTNVAPLSPAHEVFIGYVISSSPSSGEIFVKVQNYGHLNDLHDVLITNPQDDDEVRYEAASQLWKNLPKKEYYETVSKNIKSWDVTLNYTSGDLTTMVYTNGTSTITKTLNYTNGDLTSLVLSGDTPLGINLTKTFTYTLGDLTAITYS